MNTRCMALPAFFHRPPRSSAAQARRWVLAAGLLSGAGAAAHPYGPFGLPIFLPAPPPPAFLRPAPVFVPAPPPVQASPARRAQRPQASSQPASRPARLADDGMAQCPLNGGASQGCIGKRPGEDRIASEFRTAGTRP
ncbi:hypothetical protein [Pseudoduganella lutea]|uniref:Uncharacterized protein n=1 Tax=Pseudoduganella lutea TaxID=321985 RepID=A0A4P6KZG8_9BURK|nr:hypothetical protein [Pseudoduganella lutea]QBE64651.1 hypothetical protein EWM63_18015 [Pseudoduganella lutea]